MALSKYDIELDLEKQAGTSHAFLVELVGANKRVLDVGCDTGYLGEVLAAFGNRVWGFEISEVSAQAARERLVDCAVGDLETTDLSTIFEPRSFDVVVFGDVLEHLRDPLTVLRSARRLVAPGGSVLVSTPNIAHGDVRLALLQGDFQYRKLGILDETHTRFFTKESLVEFAHDAGFLVTDLRRTKAELFHTEIGVHEADFDPALVERLRSDQEATTYQFVARLVPDDSVNLSSAQALQIDDLTCELEQLRAEAGRRAAEAATLQSERDSLAIRLAEVQAAHDEAVRQRDVLQLRESRRQRRRLAPQRLARRLDAAIHRIAKR